MNHPTWSDVGVPQIFVNYVKTLPGICGDVIDVLINSVVFRNKLVPIYNFSCQGCGYNFRTEKNHEIPYNCSNCSCTKLRFLVNFKSGKNFIQYSKKTFSFHEIVGKMASNYNDYFGIILNTYPDCGYQKSHCQFDGGDIVYDEPKRAFLKAAILCPYLWDRKKSEDGLKSSYNFLCPLIYSMTNKI